ncbi:hypothetical protein SAMN03159341_10313 [Paenibacillus sp. 1_12]|nr:hypothetical protein SAMN03159341_10313 [Paenibacillus sp. 1_12]
MFKLGTQDSRINLFTLSDLVGYCKEVFSLVMHLIKVIASCTSNQGKSILNQRLIAIAWYIYVSFEEGVFSDNSLNGIEKLEWEKSCSYVLYIKDLPIKC